MYRVSFNIAIQHLRKGKKNKEDIALPESFDLLTNSEEENELELEKKMLKKAIKHLNSVEKAMLMLYLEERGNEEIADVLGITQNNVRVKMTRIREKLKNIVEAL